MPENDLSQLLDHVPGLKEWVKRQVIGTLSRRALTYVAFLLVGAGVLSPNSQEAFISDHVETASGILLELGVVAFALWRVRQTGQLIGAGIKADPSASMAKVQQDAQARTIQNEGAAATPATVAVAPSTFAPLVELASEADEEAAEAVDE